MTSLSTPNPCFSTRGPNRGKMKRLQIIPLIFMHSTKDYFVCQPFSQSDTGIYFQCNGNAIESSCGIDMFIHFLHFGSVYTIKIGINSFFGHGN